jgi:ParB-like chromosome segregation protein Spo0J
MTATVTQINTPAGDPATERWLEEHHVTWTFDPAYPLDHIDITKSLANQARVGAPLIEDVVDRYTADYQRGDTFPALLLRRASPRATKTVILGGNHRRAAATAADLPTHPAYIVEVTDTLAFTLMYGDNRRHGMPPAKHERLAQAAHLVDNGWTAKDAAQLVGVTEPALSNYRNVQRNTRRAAELGIGGIFDTLPHTHKARLATLRSDPVFTETVKLVGYARLNQQETGALVTRLNDTRSDQAALRLIGSEQEDLRDRMQDTASQRKRNRVTAYGRLNAALISISSVTAADITTPDAASMVKLRKRIRDTALHLAEIDAALKTRG